MKLSWQMVGQGIALLLQVGNIASGLVPDKDKPYVTASLTLLQGALGAVAHFSNPDGTSASIAYVKPQKPVE